MKIRIQRNSVRFRLSKSEVDKLVHEGLVQETTHFLSAQLVYGVQKSEDAELRASFQNQKISLEVPAAWLESWDSNSVVGFDGHMPLADGTSLYLLIEKDFKCLDNVSEDQSDNYDNPKTC